MTAAECACGCKRPSPNAALSPQCTADLRRDLRRLPQLDRDLEALMDPRRTITYGSSGSEGGLPYHEPAAECRSQIAHDLRWWTGMVTSGRPGARRPGTAIAAMAGWLCGQAQWIAGRSWSADMLAAMAADCGRAHALLDPLRRAVIPLPGSCPHCGNPAMVATVWQDEGDLRPSVITCPCGAAWDTTQWYRLGIILSRQKAA